MPFQSIIAINMPPRPFLVSGQPIPEPDPDHLPFGDTEDYKNSMIIHYMDEHAMSYTAAAAQYNIKFPNEGVTDEAVRKRHIRSLLRLKKKFGLKDPKSIGPVPKLISRRGQKRSRRLIDIVATPLPQSKTKIETRPGSLPTIQSNDAIPKPKLSSHLFEKACIVTWRDADKLEFKEIRNKLEEDFDWSIGLRTIERYYCQTLDRVYGAGGKKDEVQGTKFKVKFLERVVQRRMSF
ncbi:hypothetical protein GQ44DRAFT_617797 [Phaeosphaeriaceae sp. PMI808]|nr:hypothetical protein GQ44DRAFT_617797 [Phaeosphaeriaceae sp. PMI808]